MSGGGLRALPTRHGGGKKSTAADFAAARPVVAEQLQHRRRPHAAATSPTARPTGVGSPASPRPPATASSRARPPSTPGWSSTTPRACPRRWAARQGARPPRHLLPRRGRQLGVHRQRRRQVRTGQRAVGQRAVPLRLRGRALQDPGDRPRGHERAVDDRPRAASPATTTSVRCRPGTSSPRSACTRRSPPAPNSPSPHRCSRTPRSAHRLGRRHHRPRPGAAADAPYIQSLRSTAVPANSPGLSASFVTRRRHARLHPRQHRRTRTWGSAPKDAPPSFRTGEQPFFAILSPGELNIEPGGSMDATPRVQSGRRGAVTWTAAGRPGSRCGRPRARDGRHHVA